MSISIQNQGQPDVGPSSNLQSSNLKNSTAGPASSTNTYIGALDDAQDTASISAAPSQLSGDLSVRQDRVDALRAQMDTGTYTVNAHAVATAMFQNLFRS
jgi:flagellar biosynthesis anti-sigma factor FlgM